MKLTRLVGRSVTVAAITAVAVAVAGSPASASDGTVIAEGRRSGTVCVYDTPVQIPAGVMVRANDACELVATPRSDSGGIPPRPGLKTMPKVAWTTGATPAGGGTQIEDNTDEVVAEVNNIDTSRIDTAVSGSVAAAGNVVAKASSTGTYQAKAEWPFYNELGQLIYHDYLTWQYTRDGQSGYMNAAVGGGEGFCATSTTVAPYDAGVYDCKWYPYEMGHLAVSFASTGAYYASLPLESPLDAPYDARTLSMYFRVKTNGGGDLTYDKECTGLEALPVGWSTPGCLVDEYRVA